MVSPTCPTQVFKHFGTGKQGLGCLTPPLWFPQWAESLISIAQTFISWPQLWFIWKHWRRATSEFLFCLTSLYKHLCQNLRQYRQTCSEAWLCVPFCLCCLLSLLHLWFDRSFGSNHYTGKPWLQLLLALIHIELCRTLKLLVASVLPHGLLDLQVAFQLALTHLRIDPFWSLWITLRYKSWPTQVNVITHYTVPWPTTISDAPLLENGKLYSPGHAKSYQTKHPPYNSVTYDQHWQLVFALSGTSTWYHQIWSSATLTFPEMYLEYQMTGPSRSFWRNIDLNGASGSTTTSNLLY